MMQEYSYCGVYLMRKLMTKQHFKFIWHTYRLNKRNGLAFLMPLLLKPFEYDILERLL